MLRTRILLALLMLSGLPLLRADITAWPPLVDFEGFADGDLITTQYSDIIFTNTGILQAGVSLNEIQFPPYSGVNVASNASSLCAGYPCGPISILFSTPTPVVTFSGYFTYTSQLTLLAFSPGSLLPVETQTSAYSENYAGSSNNSPNELITFSVPGGISEIDIIPAVGGAGVSDAFVMDDLSVTFGPTGPTAVPETSSLTLFGTVAGLLLLGSAKVRRMVGIQR